jgi:hypothetical protein
LKFNNALFPGPGKVLHAVSNTFPDPDLVNVAMALGGHYRAKAEVASMEKQRFNAYQSPDNLQVVLD